MPQQPCLGVGSGLGRLAAAAVDSGWSTQAMVNLDGGTYALLCVIPSPSDRVPHVLKGMLKP